MDDIVKIGFFMTMLVVSYLLGSLVVRHSRFAFLHERTGRYGAIDGLRGYLALSVFAHHFMLTWYWKNTTHWWRPHEVYFQNIGLIGVMIFFMITGYLFTAKIMKDRHKTDWIKLYKSRIFRIYPLYLFAIFVISVVVFMQPQYRHGIDISSLVEQYTHWLFFHGGNLHTHDHTPLIIAGVDWTLKYEWLFYLSLPLIALVITLNRWIALLLAIGGAVYFYENHAFYAFETIHLVFFVIGGVAAVLSGHIQRIPIRYIDNAFVSAAITIALLYAVFYKKIYDPLPISLVALFFIAIAWGNSLFGLMHKKASLLLGEISYSIYLLHGAIIYILFTVFEVVDLKLISATQHTYMMPIIVVLVVLTASLTYLFIERPGITFGKRGRFRKAKNNASFHI